MSLCRNCKENISKYKCEICNCSYCLRCDSYIHSFPSKRSHLRKYITISELDSNTHYNFPYFSDNSNLNSYSNQMNDYNQIKEDNLPNNHSIPKDYDNNEENQDQKNVFFYSQTKFEPNNIGEKNEENVYDKEYENEYELNNDI